MHTRCHREPANNFANRVDLAHAFVSFNPLEKKLHGMVC